MFFREQDTGMHLGCIPAEPVVALGLRGLPDGALKADAAGLLCADRIWVHSHVDCPHSIWQLLE